MTGAVVMLLIISLLSELNPLLPALLLAFSLLYSPTYALYLAFNSKNSYFFLPTKYIFSDDNISVNTPLTQGTLKWDVFNNWTMASGHYILYIGTQGFTAIPKSAIPVQDILSFEAFLKSKIKPKS